MYIETYGCQMNVADSEVVASIMQMDGYALTEDPASRRYIDQYVLCKG